MRGGDDGSYSQDDVMKTKRLFIAASVALAMLAGYNAMISVAARTSLRQAKLAALERIPAEVNCVFLGNSLVEAGCDVEAFVSAWPLHGTPIVPVNLALGATTPVEHWLILNRALQHPVKIKYLIYGFFDDQLNAPVHGDWSDLVGNRAFSYYFPDQAAAFYAPGSLLKRWQLAVTERVPMLAERSSLWGEVELLRRHLDEVGMPARKTNRFGRVDDFNALEADDTGSFTRRCERIMTERLGFSPPIREIIRLARKNGATVIMVEMPMPTRHRQVFYGSPVWPRMHDYVQSLAWEEGAVFLTASDWVEDDKNFEDAAHLNENGAKVFSERLAATLARLEPEPDDEPVELASRR
jgi:hypothetical protein